MYLSWDSPPPQRFSDTRNDADHGMLIVVKKTHKQPFGIKAGDIFSRDLGARTVLVI